MKIFITGVCGFLGANLAEYFLDKKYDVSGCDNLIGGTLENIDGLDINFFKGDCEDLNFMKKIIPQDTDCLIHCAALAHEGLSVFSPHLITKNVFSGSVSVFTASIIKKVKRIVFCSSMARYGNLNKVFEEEDLPNPLDPYGIAKLAAEKVLNVLSEVHNFEYNIAVPHNIIGRRQNYTDPFRNVAAIMINKILNKQQPIIYGDGEQRRSFSDIRDCIYCIDRLAIDKKINKEIFNIGPGIENYISINNLYEIISNELQYNMPPIYCDERPQEVKYSNCSSKKSENLLNYATKYTVKETISDMVKDIKKRGVKNFDYKYDIEIINKLTPKTWTDKLI